MPIIDLDQLEERTGSSYPAEFAGAVEGRSSLRLSEAGGLTQFGTNIIILQPGSQSSLRHWHKTQDEFVMVLSGQLMLHLDDGEHPMGPGDCAAFPAGDPDGHCLINRSQEEARFLVVGTRTPTEEATYSDIDLMVRVDGDSFQYTRKDGTPYPGQS
ncbi:cupin domain-containing protein [Arenibacterium sp. CAU 1754]